MTPLRKRYTEDLQLRNYSPKTQSLYISRVAQFSRYFKTSPEHLGPEHIRTYQHHLAHEKRVSWSAFNQTVCALRFLYRITLGKDWAITHIPFPRRETKLPVVLGRSEVASFLHSVRNLKHRTVFMTIYATGLRISEVLNLQIPDIDSKRMMIHVRKGKGKKDRYVMLSPKLLAVLREYYRVYRPKVWLFPGRNAGAPLTRKAVSHACQRARRKIPGAKRITTHMLRHAFGTHLLESGTNIRVIQILLGHQSLRTTELYTHVAQSTIASTKSPLDSLPDPSER